MSEEEWKNLCVDNFDFIKKEITSFKNMRSSPELLALKNDKDEIDFMRTDSSAVIKQEDKLFNEIQNYQGVTESSNLEELTDSKEYNGFTYKQLFLKLVFEYLMQELEKNKDFETIYEYIRTFGKQLTSVKLKIINKSGFKSGHYWLLGIISKLLNLKTLKIYQTDQNPFGKDGYRFLEKAMAYFQKHGGELEKLQFTNIFEQDSQEFLFPIMKNQMNLKILSFRGNTLRNEDCKAIGKILSEFKNIVELDVSFCNLDAQNSKEIADGLMRAKQLEVLNISHNQNMDA